MHPKLEECKYHLNDTIKGRLCYISAHKKNFEQEVRQYKYEQQKLHFNSTHGICVVTSIKKIIASQA